MYKYDQSRRSKILENAFVFIGVALIVIGIIFSNHYSYRQNNKPTDEDLIANRACIDTIYTIHCGHVDTTYEYKWLNSQRGKRLQ